MKRLNVVGSSAFFLTFTLTRCIGTRLSRRSNRPCPVMQGHEQHSQMAENSEDAVFWILRKFAASLVASWLGSFAKYSCCVLSPLIMVSKESRSSRNSSRRPFRLFISIVKLSLSLNENFPLQGVFAASIAERSSFCACPCPTVSV